MRDSGLFERFDFIYGYQDIKLRMTRSALSMSLWVDASDRDCDTEIIRSLLKPGDVFVDVGAHIGHLSIIAEKILQGNGIVYAFEAHPRTYLDLMKNVSINNSRSIRTANVAIGDQVRWVCFTDNERANDQNKVSFNNGLFVPMVTLDAFIDVDPTLIKIDTEGYELFVLNGAKSTLSGTDYIYFEAWDDHYKHFGYDFSDIAEFLRNYGFELGLVESGSSCVRVIKENWRPTHCVNVLAWKSRDELARRTAWQVLGQ